VIFGVILKRIILPMICQALLGVILGVILGEIRRHFWKWGDFKDDLSTLEELVGQDCANLFWANDETRFALEKSAQCSTKPLR
jgi:hypothetical protein